MSNLSEVAEILKHLPGQHDQSLHAGVGGRAGQGRGERAEPKTNVAAGLKAEYKGGLDRQHIQKTYEAARAF